MLTSITADNICITFISYFQDKTCQLETSLVTNLKICCHVIFILIFQALLTYNFAAYVYPVRVVSVDQNWAEDIGWVIAVTPIVIGLLVGAIHALYNQKGPLKRVCI